MRLLDKKVLFWASVLARSTQSSLVTSSCAWMLHVIMMEKVELLFPIVICLIEESCSHLSLITVYVHVEKKDCLKQESLCFLGVPNPIGKANLQQAPNT